MYSVLKMSLNDCIQGEVPKEKMRLAPGLQRDWHSALAFVSSKVMNIFESSFLLFFFCLKISNKLK